MADTIRIAQYFYVDVPNQAGIGASMLATLRDAGVNLLAFSGFPSGRRAQIDFVPEDVAAFRAAAKAAKWKLVGPKKAFLVSGADRPGDGARVRPARRVRRRGVRLDVGRPRGARAPAGGLRRAVRARGGARLPHGDEPRGQDAGRRGARGRERTRGERPRGAPRRAARR